MLRELDALGRRPTDVTAGTPRRRRRVAGAAALIAVAHRGRPARRLRPYRRVHLTVGATTTSATSTLAANTVPNIIFEIVAGGALASLVVPLLAGAGRGRRPGAVAPPPVGAADLDAVAAGAARGAGGAVRRRRSSRSARRRHATAAAWPPARGMLRVFAPQLPLYGMGIVLTGVLQAHRRFAWPVLAPLLSSLTVIAAYLRLRGRRGAGTRASARSSRAGELVLSGRHHPRRGRAVAVAADPAAPAAAEPAAQATGSPRDGRRRCGGLAVAGAVTVAAQQLVARG